MNDALVKARAAAKAKRDGGEVSRYLTPVEKLQTLGKTPKKCIAAKCWQCEGDEDPAPKWRIGNCPSTDCGLWHQRPYQAYLGKPMPQALATSRE